MSEKMAYEKEKSKLPFVLSLIIPVSTYQLFVATVNSLAWAGLIFYLYTFVQSDGSMILWRSVLGFLVPYSIYSIYARLVYEMTISRLNIRIGN